MIPSPLSMSMFGETGEISHTITAEDIPKDIPKVEEVILFIVNTKL